MTYVDGFVMTVPKKNVAKYKKMAELGKKVWMDHGALQYFECQGDDLAGMPGCKSFPKIANTKATETVFFSFIIFKDKKQRDSVNKKVMADKRMQPDPKKPFVMPFDPKKMAYGGFKTIVQG